jgi:hypothetical protein
MLTTNTGVAGESSKADKTSFSKLESTCADSAWVLLGQCQEHPEDHNFLMDVLCGKEWCPKCGEKGSEYHQRRIGRIYPKAQQIEDMGYFVIEWPDAYRKDVTRVYSKKALQQTTNKVVDVLAGKRQGRRGRVGGYFTRGLLRWHWFGDKIQGKWNPHLNVLVDGAFIEADTLEEIKAALREALDCDKLIVNYGYCNTPRQKYQRIAYITRSTFRNLEWNRYMAVQLSERKLKRDSAGNLILAKHTTGKKKGQFIKKINKDGDIEPVYAAEAPFRNQRWWGEWEDKPVWSLDDKKQEKELLSANKLSNNECPVPGCKGKIIWSSPINGAYKNKWQAVEIGETGFYRIPQKQFNGDVPSPAEVMRMDRRRETFQANVLMRVRDKNTVWTETLDYIDSFEDIEGEDMPGEFIGREIQGEIYLN